jgi:hypothetical protein
MDTHLEAFNHNLRTILNDVAERLPDDAAICRAQKRVNLALAADPHSVITRAGPRLYAYRAQIYDLNNGGEQFFLNCDFADEAERDNAVISLIPKIKTYYRNLPNADRAAYRRIVVAMLDAYIEYLYLLQA